ncbi:hypothetical protein GB931_03975 [Modestobacter sp. I12A-02628]|uniref:Diacylglycerol O-acyltransferase n=1 Tax=Goekera deserti TaxID=2497753 RepID=A0A7K3WJ70_9ACTN|nr:hypothetical protein [Goekera deserti]MPQ97097.1 hypothetical protein [Goekera deserti]NDI46586.1 hypothetical protein [Goekera deserti]NEL56342.1 hypothetical protein [Goekera deserti]
MDVPLVEHGSLMLLAAQRSAELPNMAIVTRFAEKIPLSDLQDEAARVSASPFGLGRKLRAPKVLGARPRWAMATTPPPVVGPDEPLDEAGLARWMDEQVSVRHDPERGPGWQLAAAHDVRGGTVVTLGMAHLFGHGRDVITTLYGDVPAPELDLEALQLGKPELLAEAKDTLERLRSGVVGLARLGGEIAMLPWGLRPDGELDTLRAPLRAVRDRDPSRGRRSPRRVAAIATVAAADWDGRAAELGGSATSMQVALIANLAREARAARGGPAGRPIRMIVPVDLADRTELPDAAATVGPIQLTSATVVLPGGRASYGSLAGVRAETRRAFGEASAQVARTGRVPIAPGLVDAMKLLPDELTRRVVTSVHGHYDAAASNVGDMPPGILRLGDNTATDAVLMACPMGSDVSIAVARHDGRVQMSIVADPSRLGGGPSLPQRLATELAAWGIPARVW